MPAQFAIRFAAAGAVVAFAALAAGPYGIADAGERATLTGSTTTFEMPAGWKRAPASGERPFAILWLCREGAEPQPDDQCTIRAELDIDEERELDSLDARLAEWQRTPNATWMSPPRRFMLADQDAIESVSKGRFMDHLQQEIVIDTIVRKVDAHHYSCSLTLFEVSDYMALQGVVQSVCASLLQAQNSG